jgi:CTP synthase (UTP-ammonia lyase)
MKYIIITSGIVNHIGKHSLTAFIGVLLKHYNYIPTLCYINPYLNNQSQYLLEDGTYVREEIGVIEKHWGRKFDDRNILTLDKVLQFAKENRFRSRSNTGLNININIDETGNVPIGMKRNHNIRLFKEGIKSVDRIIHTIPHKNDKVCIILLDGLIETYDNYFWLKALREFQKNHDDITHWVHTCLLTKHGHTKNHNVYTTRNVAENINILRGQQIKVNSLLLRTRDSNITTPTLNDIAEHTEIPISDMYVSHNIGDTYQLPIHLFEQQLPQSIISNIGGNTVFSCKLIQKYRKFISMVNNNNIKKVKIAVLCADENTPMQISKNLGECIRHAMMQSKCIPQFFNLSIQSLKHKNDEMVRKHLEEYDGYLTFSEYWHGIEKETLRIFRILRTSQKILLSFGNSHPIVMREMIEFYKMLKLNINDGYSVGMNIEPDIIIDNNDVCLQNRILNTNRRGILHRTLNSRNINITHTPRVYMETGLVNDISKSMRELIEFDSYIIDNSEVEGENETKIWIPAIQDKSSPFYFSINYLPYMNSNITHPSKIIYMWLKAISKNKK